ncbi:MAG: hypothetical protein ACREMN_08360 [Gemmatimonadales bacterium]
MLLSRAGWMAIAAVTAVPVPQVQAQEHTLGVNARVLGASEVGVTWHVSPGLALRPALSFEWLKFDGAFGDQEVTEYGLGVDVLFQAAAADRLTPYVGFGATYGVVNGSIAGDGPTWRGRGLFGLRVRVMNRVAAFGEIGAQYRDVDEGSSSFVLATFPIGIIFYLK